MGYQKRSADTWRLYYMHMWYLEGHRLSKADMPLDDLLKFANKVWLKETEHRSRNYKCPVVTFGRGMLYKEGESTSYCLGRRAIVLARSQRNKIVLLHELTHALGPVGHGEKFTTLYFRLLLTYSNIGKKWLEEHALKSGIEFPEYE